MKTSTKIILSTVLLLAIGGGVFVATRLGEKAKAAAVANATPPPVSVSVAPALEMSVTEWDEFSGRIQAIDRVEIRPQVSGLIDSVHFEDGQLVKKGDLLFTIDPRPFQAELARAEAVLAGAQAKVALAQTNLDRNKRLITTRAISQNELDVATDTLLEADALVKGAEAAVLTAKINLDYTTIKAPVTGRVSRAEITVGNYVGAGLTPPILTTVVSVSPVYVEFEIDEQTYLKYAANGASGNTGVARIPVSMGLANDTGYSRKGYVKSIDNRLDTGSGTIRVRAVFDNATGDLTPGLYAKVRSGGSASQTSVLVDDRAIGTDQDKKYVMVIDSENKASYRVVTIGPMVNGLRVVRSGLKKDERIVINGLQRVRPNATVAPVAATMKVTHDASEFASTSTGK